MSPSTNHDTPLHLLIALRAVCVPRLGLNPWDESRNTGSITQSNTSLTACCTILSLGELIPRGLFLPLGLGMYTLLAGLGFNSSSSSLREVALNQSSVIPSRVYLSTPPPLVMLPGLLFIDS